MKVHLELELLRSLVGTLQGELHMLRNRTLLKISRPYPDGSRSPMINATSDLLPMVDGMLRLVRDCVDAGVRVEDQQT